MLLEEDYLLFRNCISSVVTNSLKFTRRNSYVINILSMYTTVTRLRFKTQKVSDPNQQ